jgi:hypothetical protein
MAGVRPQGLVNIKKPLVHMQMLTIGGEMDT